MKELDIYLQILVMMADHLGDGAALLLGDGPALLGHGVHVLGLPHRALLSPAAGGRHGGRGGDRH